MNKQPKSYLPILGPDDHIVTAYAESACGPGWANWPIWVLVRNNATGKIRQECIQPDRQTEKMRTLYAFSQIAHKEMSFEAAKLMRKRK